MERRAVEQVEAIAGDTPEAVHYVSCDYCFESAGDDISAGREWRAFYRTQDEHDLTVCEHCLPKHFRDE